jgi:hypothetical protein
MTRLKDLPWWPTIWAAPAGNPCPTEEINKSGVLMNVRRSQSDLTLLVDHKGVICSATVSPRVSEDALILLRHILLQQYGLPMEAISNLGIDLQRAFPPIK